MTILQEAAMNRMVMTVNENQYELIDFFFLFDWIESFFLGSIVSTDDNYSWRKEEKKHK